MNRQNSDMLSTSWAHSLLVNNGFSLPSYPPVATSCVDKKREVIFKLEAKIQAGIERYVRSVLSYLIPKSLLSSLIPKSLLSNLIP